MNTSSTVNRKQVFRILSIILALSYSIIWSVISLEKFLAMKANVWDLGYAANLIHSMIRNHWTAGTLLTQFADRGIAFLLAPLGIAYTIPALLIFQSIMLGIPAYLIYEITLHETGKPSVSLMLSTSYFLYFPLAGINWFDFHFQSLFIFFVLLGYLLLIKERYFSSVFVFLLGGLVRFPYMVLVVATSFSLLLPVVIPYISGRKPSVTRSDLTVFSLFIISVSLLAFQYLWLTAVYPTVIATHSSANHSPFLNLGSKLYTLLFLFGPFLFLPFFSKKWLIPSLGFIGVLFFFNNYIYEFPYVFGNWYSSSIVPFLFLGTIDVLSSSRRFKRADSQVKERTLHSLKSILPKLKNNRFPAICMVLILITTAFFLQPYGPFNKLSFNNFDLYENTKVSSTLFNDAHSIINMIPEDEKYVLVQNDLPQLFPRTAISAILVAPYNIGPNITQQDISENSFPFNGGSATGFVPINYTISDINDLHSLTESSYQPGYPTMLQLLQMLVNSSYYGVVAERNGIMLMERNYHGPIQSFSPFQKNIDLNSLQPNNGTRNDGVLNFEEVGRNSSLWSGPYINLCPGEYQVNISVSYIGTNQSNLDLVIGYPGLSNKFVTIDTSNVSLTPTSTSSYQSIKTVFYARNFLYNSEFFLKSQTALQNITIVSMTLTQISAQL